MHKSGCSNAEIAVQILGVEVQQEVLRIVSECTGRIIQIDKLIVADIDYCGFGLWRVLVCINIINIVVSM